MPFRSKMRIRSRNGMRSRMKSRSRTAIGAARHFTSYSFFRLLLLFLILLFILLLLNSPAAVESSPGEVNHYPLPLFAESSLRRRAAVARHPTTMALPQSGGGERSHAVRGNERTCRLESLPLDGSYICWRVLRRASSSRSLAASSYCSSRTASASCSSSVRPR